MMMSTQYVIYLTHSLLNTPSRHRGPINVTVSNVDAVACGGFHSSSRVNMVAMLLMETSASKPPTTPRQEESLPAKPSGLKRDG